MFLRCSCGPTNVTRLLRIRDFAAQPRVADPRSEPGRQVSWLAPVALRGRTQDPQGDHGRRRHLQSAAAVTGWKAEMFIPYELLTPPRQPTAFAGVALIK